MVGNRKGRKELFSYLDLPRVGEKGQIADTIAMTVEFMKYQGEVAYETSKKQAISITSTASSIGIGWSAFFLGIVQESWLTSSLGLMLVFGGTYILAFWTPRLIDRTRKTLDEIGASKFYEKWLPVPAESGGAQKRA